MVTVICSPALNIATSPYLFVGQSASGSASSSSKVGQVPIAAATADSVTQGDHLTVGQPDCVGLRIPRGAIGPDDRELAHQQAPAGQRQWALDQCLGAGPVSPIRVRNDRTAPVRSGVDIAAAIVGAGSNKREDQETRSGQSSLPHRHGTRGHASLWHKNIHFCRK